MPILLDTLSKLTQNLIVYTYARERNVHIQPRTHNDRKNALMLLPIQNPPDYYTFTNFQENLPIHHSNFGPNFCHA